MNGLLSHLDVGRGLLALIISFALYSVVQHDQNPPETAPYDLRVELSNVPPGLVVLNDSSSRAIQVRISAARDVLAGLRPSSLRAYVDLSKATAGADQYPVIVEVPDPRMRIVDVTPPRISVRLDENIERPVPVRLNRVGSVPFGYEAGEAEIDPTTATVSGPASAVRNVDVVVVEVKLDGVTSPIDSRYPALAVDARGQPLTTDGPSLRVNPPTIRVRIPVEQQFSYKTVGVQPVIVGSVQSGYVIEGVATEPSAITIFGSPQALARANFAQTEQIDVTDANATFARQVSVIVPDGVSVVVDGNVRVTVRIAPLSLTQSVSAVPTAANLTPGLQVVSALPSVQVILRGPPSALRGVQASDLRVSVNLAGLAPGSNPVTVEVTAPAGLTVQSVNPSVITVTLAEITGTALPAPPTATSVPTARPASTAIPVPTEEPPPPTTPTSSPTTRPVTATAATLTPRPQ